jgi:hypothetical protein
MSATAGNDIIETTRRRRIYGHLLHPNQTPLRSPASERAILRFSTIYPAADGGRGGRWSHWNRHEEMRPWTFESSRSD